MKKILILLAILPIISGCFSPNYSKIPLQNNDVPYILQDGDYYDVDGELHRNQHNVWAMSQSDVFDYMTYIRNIRNQDSAVKDIKSIGSVFTKNRIIYILSVVCAMLIVILIKRRKKNKPNKVEEEAEED